MPRMFFTVAPVVSTGASRPSEGRLRRTAISPHRAIFPILCRALGGGCGRRWLLPSPTRSTCDVVSKHWHIDEIRPAFIHANIPPAPANSDIPMPQHDRDEKGRMKLPAYLLTAHKAG